LSAILLHQEQAGEIAKNPAPLRAHVSATIGTETVAAILDRVLERGRFIHLDGSSGRTRHLNLEENLSENTKRLRISGIGGSDFPEPTNAEQPIGKLSLW